jgi:hypothetical protein
MSSTKAKRIALLCAVAVLVIAAVIFCVLLLSGKISSSNVNFEMASRNKVAVIQETKSTIEKRTNISDSALCTSVEISFDANEEIDYGYIQIVDGKRAFKVSYTSDNKDGDMKCTIEHISASEAVTDKGGVSISSLAELIGCTDFHRMCGEKKDSGNIKLMSDCSIELPNSKLSDNSNAMYYISSGTLNTLSGVNYLKGTYFRFTVVPDENADKFYCSIYTK